MLHLVTDSSANIPESLANRTHIHVIPTYIYSATHTLRDGVDITPDEMITTLQRGSDPLSTSEPPLHDFTALYERILRSDPQATILSIHVSGAISGTLASARRAADHLPQADIRLIDSRSCTAGHALLIMEALSLIEAGHDADSIEDSLHQLRDQHAVYFALGSTDMLRDAGRLWRLARMARGQVKPTITLREGVIEGLEAHPTLEDAHAEIAERAETAAAEGARHFALTYGADDAPATALTTRLEGTYGAQVLYCEPLCATFMYYFTPGAFGAAWV